MLNKLKVKDKIINYFSKIKNKKLLSLSRKITGFEYILFCVPFFLFLFVSQEMISKFLLEYQAQQAYNVVLFGFIFIIISGFLFLIGIRWRIIYLSMLLLFSFYVFFELGKPNEFYEYCDRDNAIMVGIKAILNGEYPYYKKTDLGNPITPLPFSFFFYMPIYLLANGHIFYMTIIISFTLFLVVYYKFMDTSKDFLILPMIGLLIFSNFFFLDIIINSDIPCSMFLLCLIIFLIPDCVPEQKIIFNFFSIAPNSPNKIDIKSILFSLFLGCIMAMRIYFWLIGIVIFLYIYRIYGIKRSIFLGILTIMVFLAWIFPFYLYDPDYFLENVIKGGNAYKFTEWRTSRKTSTLGKYILEYLTNIYHYKEDNSIYISFTIIFISFIIALIKLESKFQLLMIISFCYLFLLFFIYHGHTYIYMRDYISLAAIPFIFSFIYSNDSSITYQGSLNNNKIQ